MGTKNAVPGDFDVYLLAQTWAPQFCCSNKERCTTVPWAFSAKHLSLHGLWPGYKSGGFPESCKAKAQLLSEAMPREYIDLAPAFTRWNMERHRAEVGDLARHEWKKHGTCTGLLPETYWTEALRAMTALPGEGGTPGIISGNVGGTVPNHQLRAAYHKQVAVRTDKQCRCEPSARAALHAWSSSVGFQAWFTACPPPLGSPRSPLAGRRCPMAGLARRLTAPTVSCVAGAARRAGRAGFLSVCPLLAFTMRPSHCASSTGIEKAARASSYRLLANAMRRTAQTQSESAE
jgi:hypothetical protein